MTRRPLLLALWLGGTLSAMVMASFAVQLASARVTDRPAAVVSRGQVQNELGTPTSTLPTSSTAPPATSRLAPEGGSSASLPARAATSTTSMPATTSSTAPAAAPRTPVSVPPTSASATTTTSTSRPPGDGPAEPGGGDAGSGGPSDNHGRGPQGPSTTAPASTTTSLVATTLTAEGGWVRVRCTGSATSLLAASPNPGYAMEVVDHGPQEVEVRFSSPSHESTVKVRCENGSVRSDIGEHGN